MKAWEHIVCIMVSVALYGLWKLSVLIASIHIPWYLAITMIWVALQIAPHLLTRAMDNSPSMQHC